MDITLGQYFPTSSCIHKMDPRSKILFALGYMILIFVAQDIFSILALGIFASAIIFFSKIPIKFYFKGLKQILFIMIFTAAINLFLTGGETVVKIPYINWTISDKGIEISVFMVLRLMFLLLGTSALTFTTPPVVLTDGIEALLKPFSKVGLPSHEIAMMMTIALRFIPIFSEEADKIKKAQSARGADFETGSLISRAKAMIPILVPLFVSAFRRADDLAVAMEARCYKGGEGRSSLKKLTFSKYDALGLVFFILLVSFIVLLKIYNKV